MQSMWGTPIAKPKRRVTAHLAETKIHESQERI